MGVPGIICIIALAGTLLVLAPGCENTRDAASGSATATAVAPAVGSYASAYEVNNLKQDILILADVESVAEEISYDQMLALMRTGAKFPVMLNYIGTRHGYHYLAYYPPLIGMRKIYRIRESYYKVTKPFDLTVASAKWRTIPPPEFPSPVKLYNLDFPPMWEPFYWNTNTDMSLWGPLPWLPKPTLNLEIPSGE